MKHYRVSEPARDDLDDTWLYIARESVDVADKVLDAIYKGILLIASEPGIGHRREDQTATDLRFWTVYDYMIAYRIVDGVLEIVRVLHGHRDLKDILQ